MSYFVCGDSVRIFVCEDARQLNERKGMMMKTGTHVLFLIFAVSLNALHADESDTASVTARPVQIVTCDKLPEGLDFQVQPTGYKLGFQIYYLLEGENIVGIKTNSLKIDSMKTPDGVEISKTRNGNRTYAQGMFPEVSSFLRFF